MRVRCRTKKLPLLPTKFRLGPQAPKVGKSHFRKVRAWDREHDRAENGFVSHGLQILILGRAGSDMDESEMKERRPIRPPH